MQGPASKRTEKATAANELSIFDKYYGSKLAESSQNFLAQFVNMRLIGGSGGENGDDVKAPSTSQRRAGRFDPMPDLEKVDHIAAKRRRRAGIFKPPVTTPQTPEDPDDQKKTGASRKSVKFTKRVQTRLFAMEEASPRREGGGLIRRRVEMGERICFEEPVEDRRLKKPRGHIRNLPTLSTKQRVDILGPERTRFLSPERQLELVKDSGCKSTCRQTGCGANCSCLLNGIVCDDRVCPCDEASCPNAREDLNYEDEETLAMRADLANYDLAEMSSSDRSTIPSFDNTSLLSMYNLSADDQEDEEDSCGLVEKDSTVGVEPMIPVDEDVGGERDPDVPMDVDQDSGDREDERMDDEVSDDSDDDVDAADPVRRPFNGILPDFGVDLSPKHFSAAMLTSLPMTLNAEVIRSCEAGEWLDGQALFIALLKEATRFNEENEGSGKACSVLHPETFVRAMRLVEQDLDAIGKKKEEDEKERENRRRMKAGGQKMPKLVKTKGPEPLALDHDAEAQLIAYGNQWSEMLVPINLSNNHWATAVVSRATVSAVIFDSSPGLESRPKELQEKIKMAVRKVLEVVQKISPNDITTSRFKVRFCRRDYRCVQDDDHSCGVFAIIHARRVLQRGNTNASTRVSKNDPEPNLARERQNLRRTLLELSDFYKAIEDQGLELRHDGNGPLVISPAKVAVKLTWSSKKCF